MILQSRKQQKIILYLRDIHEGAEILGRQMLQDQINGYPHVPLPHHPDKINLEEIRNISDSVAPLRASFRLSIISSGNFERMHMGGGRYGCLGRRAHVEGKVGSVSV